jgi:hypothetical protein
MVGDYRMVLSGRRDDLAFSLMCSVYSIGEDYGSEGCPIFHPDSSDTPQKRRLAFLTMSGAYREAERMCNGSPGGRFKVVFPRPRLVHPSGYGQREPVIRASLSEDGGENATMELVFSAHSNEEVGYLVDAVKDWSGDGKGPKIVEEKDFRY